MNDTTICPRCGTTMELKTGRRGPFWGCPRFPDCRGTRSYELPGRPPSAREAARPGQGRRTPRPSRGRTSIQRGDLLESKSNDLGPGKVIRKGTAPNSVVLEYFDSPGQVPEERYTEEIAIPDLKSHHPSLESRVYWHRAGETPAWGAGRVMSTAPDGEIEVRSSGGHDHRFFRVADLYVRWSKPLRDPTPMAAVGVFESPHTVETRQPIIQADLQQRSATRGLPGLLGLSAELHEHQIIAARRVLEDRIQRYLLADEVGLGKTIEALLVLRQLLIEDPGLEAAMIVPSHLVGQWRDELVSKLHSELAPMCDLAVVAHDDHERWEPCDLLIIDEAHQLVTAGQASPHFDRLREVCVDSPRLLLLSATPALHNERAFLAMLHLLDPDVYDLADVAGFQRRLESRQELGRALLGLTPKGPAFLVDAALDRLTAVLEGEPELLELVGAVRTSHDDQRATAIRAVRQNIADTFQVHRRMIRSRRTEALSATFPLSGRRGCGRLDLASDVWAGLVDGVESVREHVSIAIEAGDLDPDDAARLMARVVGAFPDVRAINRMAADCHIDVTFDEAELASVIEAIADAVTYEVRHGENAVLFTPTDAFAKDVAAALAQLVGGDAVSVVTSGLDPDEVRRLIRQHQSAVDLNWLVVDRSTEHGTNLQYANLLLHIGLPGLVTDLEQRIGRLDRWSRVEHQWRALEATPEVGLLSDWSTIVRDGFGVHDRSLAALQRAVEQLSLQVWQRLLEPDYDVATMIADVTDALAAEVEAVREQDAIDAVTLREGDDTFAQQVLSCDRLQDERLGADFDALMGSARGNLRFVREGDPIAGTGRYLAENPSSPRSQGALVPLWRLGRGLIPALQHRFTGRRDVALREGVPVLRSGFPLFDRINDFLRHDDRGRAWGLWRYDANHAGEPEVWLRVDAHIHADPTTAAMDLHVERAFVQRRLDAAFPPRIVSVPWNPGRETASEEAMRRVLARYSPFSDHHGSDQAGDFNLNRKRLPRLLALLDGQLDDFVLSGMEHVTMQVTADDQVDLAVTAGQAELRRIHGVVTAALRRRIAGDGPDRAHAERELQLEDRALPILLDAVAHPTMAIDSIGVVVLSSENPWEHDDT